MEVDLKRTAIHEAGHAVMSYLEGIDIIHIEIIPNEDALDSVRRTYGFSEEDFTFDFDDENKDAAIAHTRVSLGGMAAELNYLGDFFEDGIADDLSFALKQITHHCGSNEQIGHELDELIAQVRQTLSEPTNARAIEQLSAALIKDKKLSGEEATTIIREALKQ